MKKKAMIAFITTSILLGIAGCGASLSGSDSTTENPAETVGQEQSPDTDNSFAEWLPEGVTKLPSETEANALLQQTIIDYYEIPEESWEETKYYYNYVDLNGDGTDEIFAVIIGSYTSGTGGSSALWCQEEEGSMKIRQAFTLVNTPVIVSENAENGAKDLFLQRSGGGAATEIVKLTCKDGVFTNVADAKAVDSIEGIKGTAILCNDLMEDMESGNYLTLAD